MRNKGFKSMISGTVYLIVLLIIGCGGGGGSTTPATTTNIGAPSAPTSVTATAGNGQVALNWTAVTEASSYKVYRGTATGTISAKTAIASNVSATAYTDTTASNGTTYYYQLTAVNSNGESAGSSEANAMPSASTTQPPSAPTGVSATGGNAQITISWPAVTGATSYNVYWSIASGVTTLNGLKVASNITANTFTDTIGLSNGTTYYYIVTAVNAYGESAASVQISATPTSTPASSVTLNGTVTYTHYSVNQTTGIDYSSPTEKPIRGAVVALQNSSGSVLASANTTQTGSYSFNAPANSTVRVVVMAALGSTDTPRVTVVDNTNGGASYGTYFDVTTGTANLTANFNANSGWDGTSYSGARAAAPFAVLDTIYQAEALIKSADPNVQFPALVVNWSKNNKPTVGDQTIGEIGTSHYLAGNLYILGAENLDTDEYDTHVMAHEWGHYFEDKLGRSDNIGGNHSAEDILDPRVAFGEGWGNALSGMVFNDPLYIDTSGAAQATAFKINVDEDSVPANTTNTNGIFIDGFYSEASVQEVLYALYKSLGFKPIYDVMVGGQKTTSAYTTIFSFLKYLKDANPTHSSDINTLAAAENINAGDEYAAFTWPIYTVVPVNGTIVTMDVDGLPLQTWDTNGPITASSSGNKLYNRMFFKFYIPSNGSHIIEVAPASGGNVVCFEINEKGVKTRATNCDIGVTASMTKSFTTGDYVMEVVSRGGPTAFTVKIN